MCAAGAAIDSWRVPLRNARTVTFVVGDYDHDLHSSSIRFSVYYRLFWWQILATRLGVVKVDANGFIFLAGETLSHQMAIFRSTERTQISTVEDSTAMPLSAKLSNDASNLVYFTYLGAVG